MEKIKITNENQFLDLLKSKTTIENSILELAKDLYFNNLKQSVETSLCLRNCVFDGSGHTITGLSIQGNIESNKIGLFNKIEDTKILNLCLNEVQLICNLHSSIRDRPRIGLISGMSSGSYLEMDSIEVRNCEINITSAIFEYLSIGGLIGFILSDTVDIQNLVISNLDVSYVSLVSTFGCLFGKITYKSILRIKNSLVNVCISTPKSASIGLLAYATLQYQDKRGRCKDSTVENSIFVLNHKNLQEEVESSIFLITGSKKERTIKLKNCSIITITNENKTPSPVFISNDLIKSSISKKIDTLILQIFNDCIDFAIYDKNKQIKF